MTLKKTPNKEGRIRLSIIDNYYDKKKKCSRQFTVESLGWLDELQKIYPDPITHFQKRVVELRRIKAEKKEPRTNTVYPEERLSIGDDLEKNFGYAALSKIYHELKINTFLINRQRHSNEEYDANTITKMLVYSRLLYPGSKKSSFEKREKFFEKTDYTTDDMYRCLGFLDKQKENLQIWLNERIKENYSRDSSLIYYDVTNYYFETDIQDDFKRKGICKHHTSNPIVQMGLFMDSNGIPITYELFPGNTNDCLTYRPNFGRIKKEFGLGRAITVADKAMSSGDNIWYTINTPTKDGYVFSMSVRGADKDIKDYVLNKTGYKWIGNDYKVKSRKKPRTIYVTSVTGKKLKKDVDEKQVVFWSEKYARRAKAERAATLLKAQNLISNPGSYTQATSYGAAKYIKKIKFDKKTGEIVEASSVLEINQDRLKQEEMFDGYYLLITSEMETPDDKIIDIYRGLWKIEESFKITKSELKSRPVFVWTKEHIEAHFLTCFIALTIIRILEMKLNWVHSVRKILHSLKASALIETGHNCYQAKYYDEVLKDVGKVSGIDFSQKNFTLKEIKNVLATTKKA